MKATNKTSTIRAKGISIINVTGNTTMYSSSEPFQFGKTLRQADKADNGKYYIIKAGQFATLANQPYFIQQQ